MVRHRTKIYPSLIASFCIVVWAGAATSQVAWPSMAEVQQRGASLSQRELVEILSEGAALLSTGPGAEGPVAIFHCNGDNSPILSFGSVGEGLQTGACRVDGSSICLAVPSEQDGTCFGIRRVPEFEGVYLVVIEPRDDDPTALDSQELSIQPAMSFAPISTDVYGLVAGSGELELGGVSLTMSPDYYFTLVYASGFPLRFVFQGEADYESLILFIDQVGWPDQHTAPDELLEQPLQRQPQFDFLTKWEQDYSQRDLRDWGYQEGFETSGYRSSELELDASPCIQTHESITSTEGLLDSGGTLVVEHISQQVCISLTTGAFVAVTAKFIEPIGINGQQAEEHAKAIFAALSLSSASEGVDLNDMTFGAFQELRGGDPDLMWEVLECVQGWNRAAQINGCNHAIRRYTDVIDAGEWLLASEVLTDEERQNVQESIHESRSTLPTLHTVRASLLQEEAPEQMREDCSAARSIAAELGDMELIESVAECPDVR